MYGLSFDENSSNFSKSPGNGELIVQHAINPHRADQTEKRSGDSPRFADPINSKRHITAFSRLEGETIAITDVESDFIQIHFLSGFVPGSAICATKKSNKVEKESTHLLIVSGASPATSERSP
jgi:hypothetical protein